MFNNKIFSRPFIECSGFRHPNLTSDRKLNMYDYSMMMLLLDTYSRKYKITPKEILISNFKKLPIHEAIKCRDYFLLIYHDSNRKKFAKAYAKITGRSYRYCIDNKIIEKLLEPIYNNFIK